MWENEPGYCRVLQCGRRILQQARARTIELIGFVSAPTPLVEVADTSWEHEIAAAFAVVDEGRQDYPDVEFDEAESPDVEFVEAESLAPLPKKRGVFVRRFSRDFGQSAVIASDG